MGFDSILNLFAKNFQGQAHPEPAIENPDTSQNNSSNQTPAHDAVNEFLDQYFSGNTPEKDPTGIGGNVKFKATVMLPPDAIIDHGHAYTKHWWTSGVTGAFGTIYPQEVTADGNVNLKDGKLLLPRGKNSPIANVSGLTIYDHDIWGDNIGKFDSFLPAIAGTRFFITDEGIPSLYLEIDEKDNSIYPTWMSGGLENRDLPNFAAGIPVGRTNDGEAYFGDLLELDKISRLEKRFKLAEKLRAENLPEELPLTPLMDLGNDLQKTNPPQRPDPELELKLPQDPLKLVRDLAVTADLYLQGGKNVIPGNDQLPGIVLGKTGDAHVKLEASATNYGARDDRGLADISRYLENSNKTKDQFKEEIRNNYSYITVTYPGGHEETVRINEDKADFFNPPTTPEQKKLLELWGGTEALIQKVVEGGYINKDVDLKLNGCAANQNGYDIRIWRVTKLSNFNVKLDTDAGQINFVQADGFPKVTIPLTHQLMLQLQGEGPHNSLSLKDWVLRLKSTGHITNNGDIEVPPLTLAGQALPGFTIQKSKTADNEIIYDNFQVELNRGQLSALGKMTAALNIDKIGFTPPNEFWNKIGFGAIPVLGQTKANLTLEGKGDQLDITANGETRSNMPLPIFDTDIIVKEAGAKLNNFSAQVRSNNNNEKIESKFSVDTLFNLAAQIKDLEVALPDINFAIPEGYAFFDLIKKQVEVTTNWNASLNGGAKIPGKLDAQLNASASGFSKIKADAKGLVAELLNNKVDGNFTSNVGDGAFGLSGYGQVNVHPGEMAAVFTGEGHIDGFAGRELPFDLEWAGLKITQAFASVKDNADKQSKVLEASAQFGGGLKGLVANLPLFNIFVEDVALSGEANVAGDLKDLGANLKASMTVSHIDTPLADLSISTNVDIQTQHITGTQQQTLSGNISFGGGVYDPHNAKKQLGSFSGAVEIKDNQYLSTEGDVYDRKITIPVLNAKLNGLSIEGFTVKGTLADGPATILRESDKTKEKIPDGITFLTEVAGRDLAHQTMGASEAKVNLKLTNAQMALPGIALHVSGQLVGRMKLVNISSDPLKPDFKPQPGFTFEVRHANIVATVFGKKTVIRGLVRITEKNGFVTINGQQVIPGEVGPQTIIKQYARIKIDEKAKKTWHRAGDALVKDYSKSAPINSNGVTKDGTEAPRDLVSAARKNDLAYYEPYDMDNTAIGFGMRIFNKNLASVITAGNKELVATGWARVKNIFKNPTFRFGVNSSIGDRTLTIGQGDKNAGDPLQLADTIIKLGEGSLDIRGANQQSTTSIKIPSIHAEHELKDGANTIMKLVGDLAIKEPILIKMNKGGLEKQTLHITGGVNIANLDQNHQLLKDKDNNPIPAGEIQIVDSSVDLEIKNTFIKGQLNSTFNIPQTTLTGKVTKPLIVKGVLLEAGSFVTLEAVGLANTITASIKKMRGDINIDTPDITLTLKAPGNPLEKAQLPLKGALEAKATLTTNHNQLHIGVDKKGFSFDLTDKPILATIFAKVGDELLLNADINTQAGQIAGTLSTDLTTHVDLKKLKTHIAANGFAMLAGEKLDLSGIIIDNVLDSSSIDYNPAEQTLTLKINKQTTLPANPPPTQIEDWLAWPKEKWEEYRAALNGKLEGTPNCNFLAVIEEPLTHIPGVKVPVGKGRVYVALSEDKFTVDLKKYPNKMDGVAALFDKVAANVNEGMLREYPVPTDKMLEGYKGDDIRYNNQQNPEGTFFILGNSDTTNLITESLGFPVNKRIDLKDFYKSKILGRYFKNSLPAYIQAVKEDNSDSFTSWPLRALTTLGRLNSDLPKMVMMKAVYRGKLTRATTFINFDDKATRGKYSDDKNAVMTSLTYSPFDPQKINKALGEMGGIKKVLDWLPDDRELTISQKAGVLPITHFELAQDNNDPYITQASGRVYVLPLTDDDGIKRSVMIFDQALGLTGDLKFLKGKNRDFGVDADPLMAPLVTWFKKDPPKPEDWPPKTEEELKKAAEAEKKAAIEAAKKGEDGKSMLNAGRLASMIGRSSEAIPSDAIPVIANGFMTQFINSVSYRLKTGEWTASPPIAQISSTPEGIKIYPEFLGVNTEKETFTISLTKDTNIDTVKKTLAAGLGIQESETDKYLPKEGDATTKTSEDGKSKFKEIPLKEIFEIPSVKKLFPNFEEFKKLSYATAEMPGIIRHRFRSHGTIYMAALHDIREKVVHMRPGRFHFLSLNSSMFRGNYGPIKEQLEEVGVTFMPFIMKKTDHLKMATALSKYEKFDEYAPANYPSSEAVDPTIKEDLSSVKINGLKDEDAQKYYDCSSITENKEYCVEAKLDAGQILRHRIRVPNKPIKGFLAPWDMMYIKDLALTENGMYTNAGEWGVTDVVGDDGEVYTMGYNLRILNTKISNETGPAVQNLAFTQMAGFLGGVTRAGAGQDFSFKMDPVVKYKE